VKTTIQQPASNDRPWLWFAIGLIGLLVIAAVRWMFWHPFATQADEAWYINETQIDLQVLHSQGLHQLARWMVHGDGSRPPAYRLLVLPFVELFGYHTQLARFITLSCYLVSGWFTYLTTMRFAGVMAGAIAALIVCLSPVIVQASVCYATEGPLYLAVAAMLYFLSAYWREKPEHPATWIGLGLAIGIGALSKTTFFFIAAPVILFSIFTARHYRKGFSGVFSLIKAGVLASLIAAPWWIKNLRAALAYAKYASRGFPRHSLASDRVVAVLLWLRNVYISLLGPAIGILVVLVGVLFIWKAIVKKEKLLESNQRIAVIGCACASIPLIIVQLSGSNYLLRHISPVMIPIAIATGVLASAIGSGLFTSTKAATVLLFSAQFLMLVFPVSSPNQYPVDPGSVNGYPWRTMVRFEQWDWEPLRQISDSCGIPVPASSYTANGPIFDGQYEYGWSNPIGSPKISYLGNGRAFNGTQIQYPWIAKGIPAPDVTWLWRYEDGPIDWQNLMKLINQSDVVLTVPHYVGQATDKQDLDNVNNEEFARMLRQDPRFQGPVRLEMGQLGPVELDVFLRKGLVCH
jgi:hypothetical protein